jgi:hypothetical protein
MSIIEQQADKGVELLWLCLKLQSEKDGVNRSFHFDMDRTKTNDQFTRDIEQAVVNMTALYKLVPMMQKLTEIGRKLEVSGKVKVAAGDSLSDVALAYFAAQIV